MNDMQCIVERELADGASFFQTSDEEFVQLLPGMLALHLAAGEKAYAESAAMALKSRMEKGLSCEDSTAFNAGKAFLRAFDETGDMQWKAEAESLIKRAKTVCGSDPREEMLALYAAQPFLVAYDVRFGDKRAAQIAAEKFREAGKSIVLPGMDAEKEIELPFLWYMAGLIDTIEQMDQQLYEHYRSLVDQFRAAAIPLLNGKALWKPDALSLLYSDMLYYSLMKGIRLGILDGEKYAAKLIHQFVQSAKADRKNASPLDLEKGMFLLALSEYVKGADGK